MLDQEIKKFWPKIQKEIQKLVDSNTLPPVALEMIDYQINTGGKRIRPLLALWIGESYGFDLKDIFPLAATVEMIHNASIVHDDLQDKDETRRGRPTAWKNFTPEQAINLGDILFILAFELLYRLKFSAEIKLEIIKLTLNRVSDLIQGQMLEFALKKEQHYKKENYLEIAEKKTASLFSLAMAGASIIGSADTKTVEEMHEAGRLLGIAFQIRDDLIDLIGKKEGRSYGGDIREGKITLPFAFYFSVCTDQNETKKVAAILLKKREKTTEKEIAFVRDVLVREKAIDQTMDYYNGILDDLIRIPAIRNNKKIFRRTEQLIKILGKDFQ